MSSDTKSKITRKEQNKRSKKMDELSKRRKSNEQSDNSDDNYSSDSESEEMDTTEYRKLLSTMFPSKYLNKKIKAGEKLKKCIEEEEEEDEDSDSDYVPPKKTRQNKKKVVESSSDEEEEKIVKNNKKNKNNNKDKRNKNKSDSENDDISLGSEDSSDEEDEIVTSKDVKNKYNIIFTIGSGIEDDDEWETDDDDSEEDDSDETEDEDESVSSEEDEEEEEKPIKKNKKNEDNKTSTNSKKVELSDISTNNNEFLSKLTEIQKTQLNNKTIQKCIEICEEEIQKNKKIKDKKDKKYKDKNSRIFKKIIRDKNTNNDFSFFSKMEIEEQKKIIKELKEINKLVRIEKPYRMTLLESNIPIALKAAAMKKINSLRYIEPGAGEFYKIKNWVDTFMKMPFDKYLTLPISIDDGVDKCHDFMANAQKTLDEAVYGLNDAKMQIMQMLGQLITNPKAIGTAIAIHGPPGTGKCMVYDTPILMYNGSIKMVQDIVVGDLVMGDDSTPRNVMSLGQGEDELYEIIPKKGEKYGVNSEHILCLKQSGLNKIKKIKNSNNTFSYKAEYFNNKSYKIESKRYKELNDAETLISLKNIENNVTEISVKQLLKLPKYIQSKLKGYKTSVDFKSKPVLFDPYIIGAWLGDGTSSKPEITNQDAVILSYIRTEVKKHNLNLNYYSGYTYRIAYDMHDNDSRNNKNLFLQVLKDYNLLNNKHIPNDYKINDKKIRLELLAGIIDTDGSYSNKDKCFDIIQKNKILSDDILFIARSLGYAAYQKKCSKYCIYKNNKIEGTYYRICIFGNNINEIPTKCIRKQVGEKRLQIKDQLVTGISINSIGWGKYYGFTLDNNHRYLLSDFTVTHNTSLVKEGISKILNRPFAFIALGGATDSSFLEGHSYTYEGSTWGKIVQIIIDSKCMNPVIYFDELDKISDTPKGEEIAGILTHLTDTSQNTQFHDKYFAEIDFDLSKCLFIFSYNDESKINPILKDRMYRIQTKGYNQKQKTVISNNYLLPRIREQVKFDEKEIIISDSAIQYIIENLCNKEDGVRNLKRCLEIIYTKLNLYRLMKPGSNLFEEDMSLKVDFPFTVTKDIVDKLIKKDKDTTSFYGLYV